MSEKARHGRHQLPPSLLAGWKAQPVSLRVLRGFLGVTFLYAGIQKFADPTFFRSGSPTYIGAQLQGFSRGSPIGPLLSLLAHFPVVAGAGVALLEIAIGLGTLLGIASLFAAGSGIALSTMLFLSASWHVHPYFLGSDSIYAVAWLSFFIGLLETKRRMAGKKRGKSVFVASSPLDASRREFMRGGVLSLLTVVVGGVALALAGNPPASSAAPAAGSNPRRAAGGTTARSASTTSGPPSAGTDPAGAGAAPATHTPPSPPPGVQIATLKTLPVGGAAAFTAPGIGPCAVVRTGANQVEAYSRICTHQGCEVGWDPSAHLLVCPCHGAEYDPSQNGRPVAGPTNTPLQKVNVVLDRQTGQVLLPQ